MRKQSQYRERRAGREHDLLFPAAPSCHKAFPDSRRRRAATPPWLTQSIRERLGGSLLWRNPNREDAVATQSHPYRSFSDRLTPDRIFGLWQILLLPHPKNRW